MAENGMMQERPVSDKVGRLSSGQGVGSGSRIEDRDEYPLIGCTCSTGDLGETWQQRKSRASEHLTSWP